MTAVPAGGSEARRSLEDFLSGLERRLGDLDLRVSFAVEYADDHLRIDITGDDSDCFLQRKAEALDALQHILRRTLEKHTGAPSSEVPVILDSHGYRKTRETELREMARIASERATKTGTAVTLDPLNPYERRIVHLACQEHGGVATHSSGDGFCRRVVITPSAG